MLAYHTYHNITSFPYVIPSFDLEFDICLSLSKHLSKGHSTSMTKPSILKFIEPRMNID